MGRGGGLEGGDVRVAVSIFNLNTIRPLGSDGVTVREITGIQNTAERVKSIDIFIISSNQFMHILLKTH